MNRLLTIVDSKYQRLEYLESSGTQWIDTGYVPTENDVIECDVQNLTLEAGEKFFFGQRTLDSDKGGLWVEQATNNVWYVRFGSTSSVSANPTNQEKNNKIHLTLKKGSFISGGGTTLSPVWSGTMQSSSLTLFCRWNTAGTDAGFSKVRYWNFRVTNNGVTKLNLVPVLRKSDNELGMLDLVEGKFYTNAGTGKFTANLDTMYAIIQGSPTINNGFVSNFSDSNYLKLQQDLSSADSWEVVFKVKMGSDVTNQKYFFGSLSYGITLGNTNAPVGAFKVFFSSNGTSWDIGSIATTISNPANSVRYVRVGFTGGKYYIEQSEDGKTYSGRNEFISATKIYSTTINIGASWEAVSRYWQGNVDLNQSYIKIDNTKYKLQAVVGYTIVGSPTITDGVVSGFSSSDYLKTNGQINVDENLYLEYGTKITIPSSILTGFIIGSTDKFGCPGIQIYSNGFYARIFVRYNGSGTAPRLLIKSNIQQNTTYWIKVIFDYKKRKINNFISTDGISWNNSIIEINSAFEYQIYTSYINLGFTDNIAFNGSIDLNETYIKVNNKLWFNGQSAQ